MNYEQPDRPCPPIKVELVHLIRSHEGKTTCYCDSQEEALSLHKLLFDNVELISFKVTDTI